MSGLDAARACDSATFDRVVSEHRLEGPAVAVFRNFWNTNPDRREDPGSVRVWAGIARKDLDQPTPTPANSDGVDDSIPPGLDSDGKALHSRVIDHMRAHADTTYFEAFAAIAKNPDLAKIDATPGPKLMAMASDDDKLKNTQARAIMRSVGVGQMNAHALLDAANELARVEVDDGSSDVPWLDARPLTEPPRPWVNDDWERDRRRGARHGVPVEKIAWAAHAEEGRDLVGERFAEMRAERLATTRRQKEGLVESARASEAHARAKVIDDELRRRASERLSKASSRRA